jgi:hypothetical protein
MITSQFGNKLKVLGYDVKSHIVCAERLDDNQKRFYKIDQLKADGGLEEILEAIAEAKNRGMARKEGSS